MTEVNIKNEKGVKDFKFETVKIDDSVAETKIQTTTQVVKNLNDFNSPIRTSKNIEMKGNARLIIPRFASDPTTCRVGELALIGSTLKTCNTVDTWTAV